MNDNIGGFLLMVLILVFGIGFLMSWIFQSDILESSKPITPTVTITTKNINGVVKSDTTYVYKIK